MTTEIIVHIKGLISDFSTKKMAKFAKLICKPKAIKCKPSDLQLTKVLHFQSDMYTFCIGYTYLSTASMFLPSIGYVYTFPN